MTVETAVGTATELAEALADEQAFRRWYTRVLPSVYGYLVGRTRDPHLAEELTQQTFVAAIAARHRFDGRSDVVTWLCGIARHKLADHFRRAELDRRRDATIEVREVVMPGASGRSGVEEREAIAAALASLPVAQRAVLVFVDLDDLPVKEAARLLGRSPGATQSLLARARVGFRAAFERESADG